MHRLKHISNCKFLAVIRKIQKNNYGQERFKHSDKKCSFPTIKFPQSNIDESQKPAPCSVCPRFEEELMSISCKTTVVVGGEDGIGFAVANEVLKERAKVVGIFGNNVCKGVEATQALNCKYGKGKAVFFKVDVTNANDLECAICKITQDYGKIRAFFNTFAICDGKNWSHELETNMVGMARSTILAHQYLADNKKGGVVVNLSGLFGLIPSTGCPTTSAAQHGIIGLSKSFGTEALYKETNVRVLVLCPGITNTSLFRKASKRALTPFMGKCLKEEIETRIQQSPEVCASAAVYLARFAETGSVWLVEGGELSKIISKSPYSHSEFYRNFSV